MINHLNSSNYVHDPVTCVTNMVFKHKALAVLKKLPLDRWPQKWNGIIYIGNSNDQPTYVKLTDQIYLVKIVI